MKRDGTGDMSVEGGWRGGWPVVSSQSYHLRPWWCSSPCHYWGPCLGQWPCSDRSQCCCPWLIATRDDKQIPSCGQLIGNKWMFKGCADFAHSLTGCGTLENWSHLIPLTALGRDGPISWLGSTMELALVAWVWVNLPRELASRKAVPADHGGWLESSP